MTKLTFSFLQPVCARRSKGIYCAALLCSLLLASFASGQLTGTKNIPGDYPTLAAAITDLNTQGVGAGGVTINLVAGNPETAPAGGYVVGGSGSLVLTSASASSPVIIQGNGNTITASPALTPGALNDAIFKLIGADWVTLQGFTMTENAANTVTTAASNNMTEWGVALLYVTATDGAQNDTIQGNTIDLDRTYQNTFGIYSNSTHTATAVTTSVTATGAAGGNSGLKVYGNTITDVNLGVVVIGPTAAADNNDAVDIGGTTVPTGNSITNFGTTGTFSAYANVSGTVNGILLRNTRNYNISRNTITSSAGGVTGAGTINGIQIPASSNTPTGTLTQTINNNAISLRGGNAANILFGISMPSSSVNATTTLSMNNNDFNTFGHTVAGTGAITFISAISPALNVNINGNTFTNMTVNTTGNVTFINKSVTHPANAVLNVNNNSIVTQFTKSGTPGTVQFYESFSTSPSTVTETNSGNNFSNANFTGATTLTLWRSADGSTSSPFGPIKTITNNTFSNIVGASGAINVLTVTLGSTAGTNTISGNTISNVSGTGAITALTTGTTSGGSHNWTSNTVNGLSSTGASAVSGFVFNGAGVTQNVSKNKIYDLSGSNASSTINGILVSTVSTNTNIFNNLIGDLRAPIASATNPINGLNITGTTATTALNVSFNTIYLNATSSGTNFGSSGILHTTNATATSATLNLRDNAIVNLSTPNGTGLTVAYRRSTATLTNYGSVSNNNALFAGTPSASRLLFFDGTNSDQTLATFKARVTPRDSASATENPPFLTTSGSNTNFLHLDPAVATQLESGGISVPGITDDFDGDMRNASTPDIGADELNGIPLDISPPAIAYTPLGNTASTGARTLTATITDVTGVPTTGPGLPVLYWKVDAGAYAPATATFLGGNQYQFTFGTGVATGNVISYYIVAQDTVTPTPNVGSFPAGGSGFSADPPSAATPPASPSNYTIVPAFSGPIDVGTGQIYTSLSGAGGLFAAINSAVVTGNVVVNLTSDVTEDGSVSLNQWVEDGAGGYTVTVQPSGGPRVISGSNTTALINLNGADRVTFSGLPFGGQSLTIRNTSATTGSVFRFINDASNNSIVSCIVEQTNTSSTAILYSTGVTTGNDNNSVSSSIVRGTSSTAIPFNSIVSSGTSTAISNSNLTFLDNQITDFGQAGILTLAGTDNITISGNDISQTANRTTAIVGININATLLGTNSITNNKIHGLRTSVLGGTNISTEGIFLGDARAMTVSRNRIYDFPAVAAGTGRIVGIEFDGASGTAASVTLVNNMISLSTSVATNQSLFGLFDFSFGGNTFTADFNSIYIGGTNSGTNASWAITRGTLAPSTFTARNNVVFNNRTGGGANHFAIGDQSAATGTFVSNYNFFAGTGTTAASFFDKGTSGTGTPVPFASWQTGLPARDANSVAGQASSFTIANLFVNAAAGDLHLLPTSAPALSAGNATGTGVTTDIDNENRPTTPDIGADELLTAGSIQFGSPTYSVTEGTATVTLDVTRTGGSDGAVGVSYTTVDGTAISGAGNDYTGNSGTLSWSDGDTVNKTITIAILNDSIHEASEDFSVNVNTPTGGATLGSPASSTVTINDNDAAPTFVIGDVSQSEGNVGTTSFIFTVTKIGATALSSSVDYATGDGTATAGSGDYQSISGTLTFTAAQTSQQVTVLVNGDTNVEPNETFTVTLTNIMSARPGAVEGVIGNIGTGTILNDDVANVPPVAGNVSVTTNQNTAKLITLTATDAEASPLTFSIVSGPSNGALGAITNVNCAGGACTADVTYTPANGFAGSDSFTYKANDGADDSNVATVSITVRSSNADLSALSLSDGTLAPAFASGTLSYTASVPNTTSSITVTPTVAQAGATVTVNGVSVTSGSPSGAIPLNVGDNPISVVVTAEDGATMQSYTITVHRLSQAEIVVEQPAASPLTDAADTVSFGNVNPNDDMSRTFVIKNVGESDLTGVSVSIDGTNAGDYTVTASPAATVLPGGSTLFTVKFAPTAAGTRTATLHILSNDADEGSFEVALTGNRYTNLEAFRVLYFGSPDNTGDGANDNDFDLDGSSNLLEFATHSDPKVANPPPGVLVLNGATIEFTYNRADAAVADAIIFQVEWKDELTDAVWSSTGVTEAILSDDNTVQVVKASVSAGPNGHRFVRLRVAP